MTHTLVETNLAKQQKALRAYCPNIYTVFCIRYVEYVVTRPREQLLSYTSYRAIPIFGVIDVVLCKVTN